MESVKTWVEISSRRLIANYNLLQQAAGPDTTVLAVIKANAYGHATELCALALARAGAPWLGVADPPEGAAVRKALTAAGMHHQPRILVMSAPFPEDTALLFEHNLTPVIWLPQHIDWLTAAANKASTRLSIHLEIDTGMARQGISPGPELKALLHTIQRNKHLHLEGLLTHFASAEIPGSPLTHLQRTRFEQAVTQTKASSLTPQWLHAGSSSSLDAHPEDTLPWLSNLASSTDAKPMVRTGIALYGYSLPTTEPNIHPALQPVLTWKTRIAALRDIAPGDTIGYNATYTAQRPMRIALLPIGYAEGLRRELSSSNAHPGGWAIVQGQRAPIVGRISMNLTTIDVTGIPATLDDEVILLGDNITADDHANIAETISYEILCAIRAPASLI